MVILVLLALKSTCPPQSSSYCQPRLKTVTSSFARARLSIGLMCAIFCLFAGGAKPFVTLITSTKLACRRLTPKERGSLQEAGRVSRAVGIVTYLKKGGFRSSDRSRAC